MLDKIFDNVGHTIKKISKILFCVCIISGIIMILYGFIAMFQQTSNSFYYHRGFFDVLRDANIVTDIYAYNAKMKIVYGFEILIASLGTFLTYGFGCLIEDVAVLKNNVVKQDKPLEIKEDTKEIAETNIVNE